MPTTSQMINKCSMKRQTDPLVNGKSINWKVPHGQQTAVFPITLYTRDKTKVLIV